MEASYVAGADPELMLVSPEGKLVSAIGIVPGTKENPHPVSKGAVQRDNVMAEFNVNPSGTSEEFEFHMREVLRELSQMVAPHQLVARASANFPEDALQDREAQVFGCDPDFDAWSLSLNTIDGEAPMAPFRSAGGHFHIGKKDKTAEMLDHPYGKVEVVKMLDVFQGIPSVILDDDRTAPARRRLYGGAGAHRPKDYGVEYRSLGNFWVRSPELVHLMYELAEKAVSLTLEGESTKIIEEIKEERIRKTINSSDRRRAKRIVEKTLSRYLEQDTLDKILSRSPVKSISRQKISDVWGI